MEEDGTLTPGSKAFWDEFYSDENGRLLNKEHDHRRSEEIRVGGSLLDHYEWFMPFTVYETEFVESLADHLRPPARMHSELRVLHTGCGNSDFCDEFTSSIKYHSVLSSKEVTVLNIDICRSVVDRMITTYPTRLYAVGNCCCMRSSSDEGSRRWWHTGSNASEGAHVVVQSNAVQVIFDKGTLDAILSAFPGEHNPNAYAYAEESIRVLEPGGIWFLISINSMDLVDSYVLTASMECKSFRRVVQECIEVPTDFSNGVRVETLGSRYHCYAYVVVEDEKA